MDATDELEHELEALHEMWWQAQFAATPQRVWDKLEAQVWQEFREGKTVPLDEWLDSPDSVDEDTREMDAAKLNELLRGDNEQSEA